MKISKDAWHRRYRRRLIDHHGFDSDFARETLLAGMGDYDYEEVPEDAADEEINCWGD